jgi:hypothetical protein
MDTTGVVSPLSKIVRINGQEVTEDTCAKVYSETPAPLTLTLLRVKGSSGGTGSSGKGKGPGKLDKSTLSSLILVYAAVCIDFIAALIVAPLLPFLAKKFGANSVQLSLLYAGYNVGSIFGSVLYYLLNHN